MEIYRGQVLAYDATNHKADVALVGSMSGIVRGMPVAHHVGPEVMTADRSCGVVFFGESDDGLVIATFDGVPPAWVTSALIKDGEVAVGDLGFDPATQAELDAHMAGAHLELDAWGPDLDMYDLSRGFWYDFMGPVLPEQYTTVESGGSFSIRDAHGGTLRLRANAGVGNYARLWLGDAAGGYDTLDTDEGWVMLARVRFFDSVSCTLILGAMDPASNVNRVWAGCIGGNYKLRCTQAGSSTTVDSGDAVDTGSYHRHAIQAQADRVDYWVDGVLAATCETNVPGAEITPVIYAYNNDAGDQKQVNVDSWATIPRVA